MSRRARAIINLAAIERNARSLRARLDERTELCAVVKADGYGHGAVASARAALAGGATRLAVATAAEADQLSRAMPGVRVLVMGPLEGEELGLALAVGAEIVAWTAPFVRRVAAISTEEVAKLHLKLDTGMGRWGVRGESAAMELAALIDETAGVELVGLMTHLTEADKDDLSFTHAQLARFSSVASRLCDAHPGVLLHAANSAATLRLPAAHFDMVRCGIALYGLDPMQVSARQWGLEPALELHSYVAKVDRIDAGDSVGYGRAFVAATPTHVGTVPIGYADGVRRVIDQGVEVLIAGARYPLVGRVSMDCLAVDLGPTTGIEPGAEVVLIGANLTESISAEEVAQKYQTINYEVVCSLSGRVGRMYVES